MKTIRIRYWPGFLLLCGMLGASPARAGTLVQFQTPIGNIAVELYDADKPVTTANFLRYITNGLYQNSFMHRLVPGFVVQGGGFFTQGTGTNEAIFGITTFPSITNEIRVGTFYSNTLGTIAMAKTSDPNSATSQFFFNLADNSASLDSPANSGGFTVFGRVIAGSEVLSAFNQFTSYNGTNSFETIYPANSPLDQLPVLFSPPNFSDLIYTSIFVLQQPQLRINALTNGLARLTWGANTNLLYYVDASTNSPPVWHQLGSTNGSGATLSFVVTNQVSGITLYRLRLAY
jgi:cyclophilin family peptidyl-prolyl cis-trans isomerase